MSRLYQVEVTIRGRLVDTLTVEASDALTAINQVEAQYGEPPQVGYKTIHHEGGIKETLLVVSDWHGYSFLARAIKDQTA